MPATVHYLPGHSSPIGQLSCIGNMGARELGTLSSAGHFKPKRSAPLQSGHRDK
jgi:hypothetical protein